MISANRSGLIFLVITYRTISIARLSGSFSSGVFPGGWARSDLARELDDQSNYVEGPYITIGGRMFAFWAYDGGVKVDLCEVAATLTLYDQDGPAYNCLMTYDLQTKEVRFGHIVPEQ